MPCTKRSARVGPRFLDTDQGAQFTADALTTCLLAANIRVSMDGRALDNVFCERLWRSVKYEIIYFKQYDTMRQLHTGPIAYFDFYHHERPHQSRNYRTLAEEHFVFLWRQTARADQKRPYPSGCILSFPLRGPVIRAHHRGGLK